MAAQLIDKRWLHSLPISCTEHLIDKRGWLQLIDKQLLIDKRWLQLIDKQLIDKRWLHSLSISGAGCTEHQLIGGCTEHQIIDKRWLHRAGRCSLSISGGDRTYTDARVAPLSSD